MHRHRDDSWLFFYFCYKWLTWICCASLSGLGHPVLLTEGLSLCCFVPADLFLPALMQHTSGSDTVEQGKNWRQKLHFNHSTLSVDTIRDQWHFPLLKEFILLSDLETISLNSVMFPPRCVFQGGAACEPQHCAALVSMLISFSGSIFCIFILFCFDFCQQSPQLDRIIWAWSVLNDS